MVSVIQFRYVVLGLLVALLVSACGYKPASKMVKHIFHDTIYVSVDVDRAEPENAPFVKDEIRRMVMTRFGSRIVSKEEANSTIHIRYSGTSFRPLAYENGYITRYRAYIRASFTMETKLGTLSRSVSEVYESDIQASSILSSNLRIEAIRTGLSKALDSFLAYVAMKGMQVEQGKIDPEEERAKQEKVKEKK
jgi:hypothetical protein